MTTTEGRYTTEIRIEFDVPSEKLAAEGVPEEVRQQAGRLADAAYADGLTDAVRYGLSLTVAVAIVAALALLLPQPAPRPEPEAPAEPRAARSSPPPSCAPA